MILYDVICYHMMSYGIIWYHMISYDVIWCHMISYDVIWYHMISYDMIWYHMISYDIIWQDKTHVLDMFRTCSEKVLGVKNEVFPKSLGDLWAIIWHHRRCQRRGLKIFSKTFFPKKNKSCAEFFSVHSRTGIKFRSFFSSCFMHFSIFPYFPFFPPCRLLYTPFGPLKGP